MIGRVLKFFKCKKQIFAYMYQDLFASRRPRETIAFVYEQPHVIYQRWHFRRDS
jgi:hypothetical protein